MPSSLEQVGRRRTGDPRPDHRDVDVELAGERREGGLGALQPERRVQVGHDGGASRVRSALHAYTPRPWSSSPPRATPTPSWPRSSTPATRATSRPFTLDEAAFRFMSTTFDDDLGASRVAARRRRAGRDLQARDPRRPRLDRRDRRRRPAPRQGRRRGADARRARRGADPRPARGLARGARSRTSRAIRLYEKLGFERVRGLEVWTLDGLVFQKHKVRAVAAVEQAQERIRARADAARALAARGRVGREPRRRRGARERPRRAPLPPHGRPRLAAAGRRRRRGGRPRAAAVRSRRRRASLHWLNGPEGDPFNAAIAVARRHARARQHEMLLTLSSI